MVATLHNGGRGAIRAASLAAPGVVRLQLWTWFIGMLLTTLPWHVVGVMGQPRRMAYYDYTDPALAPQAMWVTLSAIGGFVLVFSTLLLIGVLVASHRTRATAGPPLAFSLAVHPPRSLPASLNGFGVWMLLVIALTVVNYGYPIVQSLMLKNGVAGYPVQLR
jgi:cytochrome c oxidase subunit 1